MPYTNVDKPTSSTYSRVTFEGTYEWDDPTLYWDDPDIYWDGNNVGAYTNITKPTGGFAYMAWQEAVMTWAEVIDDWTNPYTNIAKPT